MSEAQFRQDVIGHLTALRNDLNRLGGELENIKLTLNQHRQLLQCAYVHLIREPLALCSWADKVSHCRDYTSSMLSMQEIQADYKARLGSYRQGGDCNAAAAAAWEFFDRAHRLMCPKLVQGVLFSASGGRVAMENSGSLPDRQAGISPAMRSFKLLDCKGCVWVPDEPTHSVMNAHGASHRVTFVTTMEGARVAVDWGIEQFSALPGDIRLFV